METISSHLKAFTHKVTNLLRMWKIRLQVTKISYPAEPRSLSPLVYMQGVRGLCQYEIELWLRYMVWIPSLIITECAAIFPTMFNFKTFWHVCFNLIVIETKLLVPRAQHPLLLKFPRNLLPFCSMYSWQCSVNNKLLVNKLHTSRCYS